MRELTDDQRRALELLVKTFPETEELSDDTLRKIVHGEVVDMRTSQFQTHMNLGDVIAKAVIYVPLALQILQIIKTYREVRTPPKPAPTAKEIADEVLARFAGKPTTALAQDAPDPAQVERLAGRALGGVTDR